MIQKRPFFYFRHIYLQVIALAKERASSTELIPSTTTSTATSTTSAPTTNSVEIITRPTTKSTTTRPASTSKIPNSIQDQLPIMKEQTKTKTTPSLEDVLKQYNLNGIELSTRSSSKYGTSDDAILASILNENGIAPPTPKSLADEIKQSVSTVCLYTYSSS